MWHLKVYHSSINFLSFFFLFSSYHLYLSLSIRFLCVWTTSISVIIAGQQFLYIVVLFAERNKCCCLWQLLCFYETIIVLSFPVVFFAQLQVHLYAYTHFYIEPPVGNKMTGTEPSKAHPWCNMVRVHIFRVLITPSHMFWDNQHFRQRIPVTHIYFSSLASSLNTL